MLRVRDTGVGIDDEMLPRIFDLFVQERQSIARSQGGLGLGLAIVRGLVELHGGTVSATSAGKGQGAEFTVRFPQVAAPKVDASARDSVTSAAATIRTSEGRVLVVDDNADAADLLGDVLRTMGYEVRIAYDGPSALREAESFEPNVALIDIGLPVMDGYEVAERILGQPRLQMTKVVAVTGYGQPRDRDATARAGFSSHLVKPVDGEHLRAVLAQLQEE